MALNLTANFKGVQEWDATRGGFTDVEPGLYEVTTIEVGEHKATVKFVVKGSFGQTEVFSPKDMTKESNLRKMKAAVISHGANPAKLEAAGEITLSDPLFVNKKAYLLVTKVEGTDDKGRALLNDKSFVTPAQAAAWKKAQKEATPAAASNGAAAPAAAAGTPPADAGLGDLFS